MGNQKRKKKPPVTGEADDEFEANFPSFPSYASREITIITTAEEEEEKEEKTSSSSFFSSLGRLKRNEEIGASSSSSPIVDFGPNLTANVYDRDEGKDASLDVFISRAFAKKNKISNFERVLVSVMATTRQETTPRGGGVMTTPGGGAEDGFGNTMTFCMPEDAGVASVVGERKATLGTPVAKALGGESAMMKKVNQRGPAMQRPCVFAEDEDVVRERFRGGEWKALDARHVAGAMLDLDVAAPDDAVREAGDGRFAVPGKSAVHSALEKSQVSLSRRLWLSLGCPPADALVCVRKATRGGLRKVKKVTLKLYAMEAAFAVRAEGAWLRDSLARNRRTTRNDLSSLEMLALRALRDRGYRVGQIVRLPLLGVSALFEVISMTTTGDENMNAFVSNDEIGEIDEETETCELLGRDANESDTNAKSQDGKNNNNEEEEEDEEDHIGSAVCRARAAGASIKSESSSSLNKSRTRNVLAGCESHIVALKDIVTLPLVNADLFKKCGVAPPRGALLWGPPGTGKTLLARHAAETSNATLFVVDGPELVGSVVGETEEAIREVFRAAAKAKPAIVLIDELDALCPSRGENVQNSGGSSGEGGEESNLNTRAVAALTEIFDGNVVNLDGIIVLATTNRPDAVDAGLRRPGRFDRELEVNASDPQQRFEILKSHLGTIKHDLTEEIIRETAWTMHGFVGADIAQLVRDAASNAMRRIIADRQRNGNDISGAMSSLQLDETTDIITSPSSSTNDSVTIEDFIVAKNRARPSAMRDINVEISNVDWDDVGGQTDTKSSLKELVEWAETHPDAMQKIGAKPPNGILLYGPPGCSKTTLARAVASQSKRNFLAVKGPELFSKYVGESEKAVKTLFKRARSVAPSIIFIDEIDGLASSRGGGETKSEGSSVYDRVVTQLLLEMDGLNSSSRAEKIAVIAATNRPDLVDEALLRPGRFDRLLFVKAPETSKERAEILACAFRKTPLAPDVNLERVGDMTEKFTGADLANLAREAALCALEEEDENETEIDAVYMRHVEKAISSGSSTASPEPSAEMLQMYNAFSRRGY